MKRFFCKQQFLAAVFFLTALSTAAWCLIYQTNIIQKTAAQTSQDALAAAMETALYKQAEFFGANAFVPLPTAEARKNLAAVAGKYPNEAQIFLKLSELDERLADYEAAERELNRFVELSRESEKSLEILAEYYRRRAQSDREAATLERILKRATGENRVAVFTRLIETAHRHRLEKYLQPAFYREIIAQNPDSFAVVEKFVEKLITDQDYAEALVFVRQWREKAAAHADFLLGKEIEILLADNRESDAEAVYHQAFNPFWSGEQAEKYYQFLDEQNRLNAYKNELRIKFKNSPTNFDAAVRLFHAEKHGWGDEPVRVLLKLEGERAKQNINWQPAELLTVARLLLVAGEGDAAARFLYTLQAQNKLEKNGEMRAKVLYQLFEIMSDAESEQLALTAANLDFYRDVASADSHPGITTGVLSLIFADTNPSQQLKQKEQTAARLFNRAAAYKLFTAYKEENPASPQLAQMYLDIVRLYTAANEPEVAAKTLAEFEARQDFEKTPAYPIIALKLADAFVAAKQYDKERAVYQKLLDYLGNKQNTAGRQLVSTSDAGEPTLQKPDNGDVTPNSNRGINIPVKEDDHYNSQSFQYKDFLIQDAPPQTNYAEVLNRYVASLNREKQTNKILSLYAAETAKYPNEAGLYEQMLQWLGQTNLVEEQLKVYKAANKKFPSTIWQDRLARWFLHQRRSEDFARFSQELIEDFDDAETQKYLAEFMNGDAAQPESFKRQLYLALYTKAHQRFPHNINFVKGLLDYYQRNKQDAEWRKLAAAYYFESPEIRNLFLEELARNGSLREFERQANEKVSVQNNDLSVLPYKLFRADAAARLSNFEEAIAAYRELNELYPNTPEYAERLIAFTRSLGQTNRTFLHEAAEISLKQAENLPSKSEYRIRAGEIQAELGDYAKARAEWQKLLANGAGDAEIYQTTATVFWDYFQYDDALQTIQKLRAEKQNQNLYAFEAAVIYEDKKAMPAALAEYLKALDGSASDAENAHSSERAKERLETLYRRGGVPAQLQNAFLTERTKINQPTKISALVLGYADFLRRVKKWNEGKQILQTEAARSDSAEFLTEARELSRTAEDADGEQFVLRRLAAVAKIPRSQIRYNLQLAESLSDKRQNAAASQVLDGLIAKFPTNYGVLRETADFYWRIDERENAVRVLQTAMGRGRGAYRVDFGRKLAARLTEQKREAEAETILQQLYAENPLDYGVFQELTKIYVRTGSREKLIEVFDRTLSEIKRQNVSRRETDEQTASLRTSMINAFTRLKDYDAAVAQHIEIINRAPDDEANTAAAISYVRRYGGAQTLIDYYQKTATAAYKNYRWFVVLARIHEAEKDYERAAENYRTAIQNQPEMLELHEALADVYEKQENFNAAIATVNRMLELSNDEPQYLQRLIRLLEKTGRRAEAEVARQKLPAEIKSQQTLTEQFSEAEKLKSAEKTKALELYRTAYQAFAANPLEHELKTAEIVGYVKAVRTVEPLNETAAGLWTLRDKLTAEAQKMNSTSAGRARTQRQILDAAIVEAVGGSARDFATAEERTAIFNDLTKRLETSSPDDAETLAALQNFSVRAGFGLLEEKILILQKDRYFALQHTANYHQYITALVNFYRERGDFRAAVNALEIEKQRDLAEQKFSYLSRIAENARLAGDREKELAAQREHIESLCDECDPTPDEVLIRDYFKALGENGAAGRAELTNLAQSEYLKDKQRAFQLQLINFLYSQNERELAHAAIENSSFSVAWKRARQAQTSFVFEQFAVANGEYFRAALALEPIGEMVENTPQPAAQLTGEDWFKLSQVYGKWLDKTGADNMKEKAADFLPATVELRPHSAAEQTRLAVWYLERKNAAQAIEHAQLALELEPDDQTALATLGAAHFLAGDEAQALKVWRGIIEGEQKNFELYFQTLEKHGRAYVARAALEPVLVERLKDKYVNEDTVQNEIGLFARSFGDNLKPQIAAAQAAALRKIAAVPDNAILPELVITGSLAAKNRLAPFYELLIANSEDSEDSDYQFTALVGTNLTAAQAEAALDISEEYSPDEPEGDKIKWQRKYLDYLFETKQTDSAERLTGEIEFALAQKYARPVWLRLARLRVAVQKRGGANVLPALKEFVGINPNAETIVAPSIERLSEAVKMLQTEKQEKLADELQATVYARLLALEKYDQANFSGLANSVFKRGDAKLGTKLLQTMVDIADEEKRDAAMRELAALDLIHQNAVDPILVAESVAGNTLQTRAALRLAAEISAQFEQRTAAIDFRKQLLAFASDDAPNRIELAKLLADDNNLTAAADALAPALTNAEFSRRNRWQAVWTAAQISAGKSEFWNVLNSRLENLGAVDSELKIGVSALEMWKTSRAADALNLLQNTRTQTANLTFLNALIAKESGQPETALNSFLATQKIDVRAELPFVLNAVETETVRQIIALYASQNQPRAALKLAEKEQNINDPALLALLAKAAEEIGDFKRAIDFETTRKTFLTDANELQAAENRIAALHNSEIKIINSRPANLKIDAANVSE